MTRTPIVIHTAEPADGELTVLLARALVFSSPAEAQGLDLTRLLDAVNNAYAALEATNSRLRDAIAHIGAGFAIWAPDERLTLCNDIYRKMLPTLADLMMPGMSFERLMAAALPYASAEARAVAKALWATATAAARALDAEVEIGWPIPGQHYVAVAKVLAFVYSLKGRKRRKNRNSCRR